MLMCHNSPIVNRAPSIVELRSVRSPRRSSADARSASWSAGDAEASLDLDVTGATGATEPVATDCGGIDAGWLSVAGGEAAAGADVDASVNDGPVSADGGAKA